MISEGFHAKQVLEVRVPLLAALVVLSCSGARAKKPNILVLWASTSASRTSATTAGGVMGYQTPKIDRIAREGVSFTDSYAPQSCTAGCAAFIGGPFP